MKLLNLLYKYNIIFLIVSVFLVGWLSNSLVSNLSGFDLEKPLSFSFLGPKEVNSPSNRIKKEQIHVYSDKIIIDLANAQWAQFTDTNSMDPVLDIEANSFEIIPSSTDDIHVGDIISYKPESFKGLIVHRVVETGQDSKGWYVITKGDNLAKPDPEKVRFEQISGVLVGIIY